MGITVGGCFICGRWFDVAMEIYTIDFDLTGEGIANKLDAAFGSRHAWFNLAVGASVTRHPFVVTCTQGELTAAQIEEQAAALRRQAEEQRRLAEEAARQRQQAAAAQLQKEQQERQKAAAAQLQLRRQLEDQARREREQREAYERVLAETQRLEAERASQQQEQQEREHQRLHYPRPAWLQQQNGRAIAVAGYRGVGKSSTVNFLRGVAPGDEGAAAVGVVETTMSPTAYPLGPAAQLYDLPGGDTRQFRRETYIQQMGIRHFDVVLIVVAGSCSELVDCLVAEVQRCGVPAALIGTKLDTLADNNAADYDRSVAHTIAEVRAELLQHSAGLPVFVVSTRRPELGDTIALRDQVMPALLASTTLTECAEALSRFTV
eukprot:TRINITY_DN2050_c0_g1_i1.p1 TRINITY_DN2050_c0_g1~~TRINITY_DN2050_c0_g1_i1.p1  ORF type:complete len:377 (+),score=72.71 TRINITY_DN2050_c0_g1_i1:170-1300(+)